jgi:hypothetical protein
MLHVLKLLYMYLLCVTILFVCRFILYDVYIYIYLELPYPKKKRVLQNIPLFRVNTQFSFGCIVGGF